MRRSQNPQQHSTTDGDDVRHVGAQRRRGVQALARRGGPEVQASIGVSCFGRNLGFASPANGSVFPLI